jgi:hypothetical protein
MDYRVAMTRCQVLRKRPLDNALMARLRRAILADGVSYNGVRRGKAMLQPDGPLRVESYATAHSAHPDHGRISHLPVPPRVCNGRRVSRTDHRATSALRRRAT